MMEGPICAQCHGERGQHYKGCACDTRKRYVVINPLSLSTVEVFKSLGVCWARDSKGRVGPLQENLSEQALEKLKNAGFEVEEVGGCEWEEGRRDVE